VPPISFGSLIAQAQAGGGTRELVDSLARTPLSKVVMFVVILSVIRIAVHPFLMKTAAHKRTLGYAFGKFANEMLDAFIYAGVFVFMLIRPFGVQAFLIPSGSMWPTLYVNDFIVANKAIYRYSDPKVNDVVVFRPPVTAKLGPDQVDEQGEMKVDFIKRCIGTPGDLIEMKKGVLYRNGQMLDEQYKAYSECTDQPQQAECQNFRMLSPDEKKGLTMTSFKLVKYKGKLIPLNYDSQDANSPSPRPENFTEAQQPYHVAEDFQISDPDEQAKAKALPAEKIPAGMYLMMGDNRNNSFDGRGWGLVPRDWIIGRSEFVWFPISRMHVTR
jgi:signal peptidase I